MLRLGLLGPPTVERDGTSLAFDTRKSVALLALLAIQRRAQGRETLAAALWPESDEVRARSSLRRTLSVTASAVGPSMRTTRATVELDAAHVWCDVWEFERLSAAGDPSSLSAAAALYRDAFLAGFHARAGAEFEHWQEVVAEGQRQRLGRVLEQLVDVEVVSGRLDAALAHARRWLALDELGEPAHRALMRVLAWSGERSASLDQYRRCVRVLDEELGVAPLDETTALYEEIRADELARPPRVADVASARFEEPAHRRPAVVEEPAQVLLRCQEALVGALSDDVLRVGADGGGGRADGGGGRGDGGGGRGDGGRGDGGRVVGGRAVVIAGPAGSGKSWVVELLRTHVGADRSWIAVRCHEGERLLELGCATELLRATFAARADVRDRIGGSDTNEIARLVPDLVGSRPPDAPLESPGAQVRFFRAVASVLGAASGSGDADGSGAASGSGDADGSGDAAGDGTPAVVVVEDLEYIDESSSALLAYLVRRLDDLRALVLLTCQEEGDVPDVLAAALGDAERQGRLARYGAPFLDERDVRAVLAARGIRNADPAALLRQTGGLALLVMAYADSLAAAETGPAAQTVPAAQTAPAATSATVDTIPSQVDVTGTGRTVVPTTARQLFARRLAGVTTATGQVLSAAATLGASFDAGLLRRTSGRSEAEVADALDEALARGLLVEHSPSRDGRDSYEFSYEGLRRVAYESCGVARRRLLHGRAADALARRAETTPAGSLVATVALHMARAGRAEEAALWAWRAGQRSIALFAHAEALEHLREALALGYPAAEVHCAIADALVALGRYREAGTELEQAASVDQPDAVAAATIEHRLAAVHERLGNWPVASAHIEAALELSRTDAVSVARIEADRAFVAFQCGDPRSAELASAALDGARRSGDALALAQAYNVAGMLASASGDVDGAEELLRAGLGIATASSAPAAVVAALNNLAQVLHEAGRTDEAVALAEEALQRGIEYGDVHRVAALHSNLADLLHASGRVDASIAHLKEAAVGFASVDAGEDVTPGIWTLTRW